MNTSANPIAAMIAEVEKVVIGKRNEIVMLLTAMLSGSHVLIEDVPGTGKTNTRCRAGPHGRPEFPPRAIYPRRHGLRHYRLQSLQPSD